MMLEGVLEGPNRWNVLPFSVDTVGGPVEILVAPGTGSGTDADPRSRYSQTVPASPTGRASGTA